HGRRGTQMLGAISEGLDDLLVDVMRPLAHVPAHPLRLARFGLPSLAPAALVARWLRTPQARALFGGVAAHAFHPLARPMTSAVGLMLIAAGHRYGWAVAEGGSRSIADALAKALAEHGGTIETGVRVRSLAELPPADAVLLDLAPGAVADVAGDRLPPRVARAYRRWQHGPGAFKVDLAVEGGIPWTNEACRTAGAVHLGGPWAEIAATERDINRGRMPERPFVLVGQQYPAGPTGSPAAPAWRSTPIAPASRACISARRPRRPAPASMACAATTPPGAPCGRPIGPREEPTTDDDPRHTPAEPARLHRDRPGARDRLLPG